MMKGKDKIQAQVNAMQEEFGLTEENTATATLDQNQAEDSPFAQADTTPPAPASGNTGEDDGVDWKRKFDDSERRHEVLKGKYDAEVPRLQQQLKDMKASFDEKTSALEEENRELREKTRDPNYGLNEEDLELTDVQAVEKIAKQLVAEETQALRDELGQAQAKLDAYEQKVGQVEETAVKTQENVFYDALDKAIPDWEAINESAAFKEWLKGREKGTRDTRHSSLSKAVGNLDSELVIELLNEFKAQGNNVQVPSVDAQMSPTPAAEQAPAQSRERSFTVAEFEKYQADLMKNRIKDSEQAAQLQRELDNAVSKNLITP